MKIDFNGKPLCTGQGLDSPDNFSYIGERSEQVSRFLRGVQAIVRDRGNEYTAISFDLTRSHGSVQAAEKFALNHRASFPLYGTLTLTCDDGSGKDIQVMYLPKALFKAAKIKYIGMITVTNYTFTGGALTATKPTS